MACCNASAMLKGPGIRGKVQFFPRKDGTLVTADIRGLSDGFFGFHIHEGTDCGGQDFSDSMGHYNPGKTGHPDHAGDLPVLLSTGGRAFLAVLTGRFRVQDVIGKTVIIHGMPDDFRSQPAGDTGMKIACGVIRRV